VDQAFSSPLIDRFVPLSKRKRKHTFTAVSSGLLDFHLLPSSWTPRLSPPSKLLDSCLVLTGGGRKSMDSWTTGLSHPSNILDFHPLASSWTSPASKLLDAWTFTSFQPPGLLDFHLLPSSWTPVLSRLSKFLDSWTFTFLDAWTFTSFQAPGLSALGLLDLHLLPSSWTTGLSPPSKLLHSWTFTSLQDAALSHLLSSSCTFSPPSKPLDFHLLPSSWFQVHFLLPTGNLIGLLQTCSLMLSSRHEALLRPDPKIDHLGRRASCA
jgi:hypothetical protein